jgi:hypothetical protein
MDASLPNIVPDGQGGWYIGCTIPVGQIDGYVVHLDHGGDEVAPGVTLVPPYYDAGCYPRGRMELLPDAVGGVVAVLENIGAHCSGMQGAYTTNAWRLSPPLAVAPGWPMAPLPPTNSTVYGSFTFAVSDGKSGVYVFGRPSMLNRVDSLGAVIPDWPQDFGAQLPGDALRDIAATNAGAGPWAMGVSSGGANQRVIALAAGAGLEPAWRIDPVTVDTLIWEAPTYETFDPWYPGHLIPVSPSGVLALWRKPYQGGSYPWAPPGQTHCGGALNARYIGPDGSLDPPASAPAITFAAALDTALSPPQAVSDHSGGAYVAWQYYTASVHGIHLLRLDGHGAVAAGWDPSGIEALPPSAQSPAKGVFLLASDGVDGALIAWQDTLPGAHSVRVLRYHGDGSRDLRWPSGGVPVHGGTGDGEIVTGMVADGSGGTIVAWAGSELFATRVGPNGIVAALASVASAGIADGIASLEWQISDPIASRFAVERRVDSGPWSRVAELVPDGRGMIRFTESVPPGASSLAYRLSWSSAAQTFIAGEATLMVPHPGALAIRALVPNPADGRATLQLDLATDEPVEFALFDVAGRRVLRVSIPADAGGSRSLVLDRLGVLPVGVYRVRVTQGAARAGARLIITR